MDAEVNLITQGDLHADINLYGENIELTVNGLQTVIPEFKEDTAKSNSFDYDYVMWKIYEIFMKENPISKEWEITEFDDLTSKEQKFWFAFNSYFVSREELYMLISQQNKVISQLKLELMALQQEYTSEEQCSQMLRVVKELNLSSVVCGDTTYYNHLEGDAFIALREIKVEENFTETNYTAPMNITINETELLEQVLNVTEESVGVLE